MSLTIGLNHVAVRKFGKGARPVVALHCSLAHGGAWAPLGVELGETCRMQAPDLPGHGASDPPPRDDLLHDLSLEVAIRLAEDHGAGAPVDIFGHSFGGTVALRMALTRPDLVRSLTLFEPVLFSAARDSDSPEVAQWLSSQLEMNARIAAGEDLAAATAFHDIWGHGIPLARMPAHQRDYIVARIRYIASVNAVIWDDAEGMLAEGRLEGIACPVMLLRGSRSPKIIDPIFETLMRRIPQAQRVEIAGAGHMLPLTHATQIAPSLRVFLGLA